jgi:DNA-binding response OmpR family regulator
MADMLAGKNLSETKPNGYRILISDDCDGVQKAFQSILEQNGFTCRTSNLATETIKEFIEFEPHLLTTDIMKPGLDGLEMVRALRSELPKFPIIIITSKCDDETRKRAQDLGVDAFMPLPITPEELVRAVWTVLKNKNIIPDKV